MNDLDYEALFNQILIKNRDQRRSLKSDLDECFDSDTRMSSEVLEKMIEVNNRARHLEEIRATFTRLLERMRVVRTTRDELIGKVDELYAAMRCLLDLKEEMADRELPALTDLFRRELANPEFKFLFHLIDEREVDALSVFRGGGSVQPAREHAPDPASQALGPTVPAPVNTPPMRAESRTRPPPLPRPAEPEAPPISVAIETRPPAPMAPSAGKMEARAEAAHRPPSLEFDEDPVVETTVACTAEPAGPDPMIPMLDLGDDEGPEPQVELQPDHRILGDMFDEEDGPSARRPAPAPAPEPEPEDSYEVEVDVLKIISDDD